MRKFNVKWFVITFIIALAIEGFVFSNEYDVVSQQGTELIVNRKGKLLKFHNFTPSYKMDSITLYFDFDMNYESLEQ